MDNQWILLAPAFNLTVESPFVETSTVLWRTQRLRIEQIRRQQTESYNLSDKQFSDNKKLLDAWNFGSNRLPPPAKYNTTPSIPETSWANRVLECIQCLQKPSSFLTAPPGDVAFDHLVTIRQALSSNSKVDEPRDLIANQFCHVASANIRKEEIADSMRGLMRQVDFHIEDRIGK
jgi:hypothetical protein